MNKTSYKLSNIYSWVNLGSVIPIVSITTWFGGALYAMTLSLEIRESDVYAGHDKSLRVTPFDKIALIIVDLPTRDPPMTIILWPSPNH